MLGSPWTLAASMHRMFHLLCRAVAAVAQPHGAKRLCCAVLALPALPTLPQLFAL